MKYFRKIGVVLVLGTLAGSPVVPQDITYSGKAWRGSVVQVDPYISATSSYRSHTIFEDFPDEDGDGYNAVGLFLDPYGEEVYRQIPDDIYENMKKRGGASFNPTLETRFISPLAAVTNKTMAAIGFDATSTIGNTAGASDMTVSHTIAGSNRFILACSKETTVRTDVTAVAYNGRALKDLANTQAAADFTLRSWATTTPDTGTNNLVYTFSGSEAAGNANEGYAVSYTGVLQTEGAVDATDKDSGSGATSVTTSITTVADNSWAAICVRHDQGGVLSASTGDVLRISAGNSTSPRGDSAFMGDSDTPITPAGAFSQTVTWVPSATWAALQISFAPAAEAASSFDQNSQSWWSKVW